MSRFDDWSRFHQENPRVFSLFQRFAEEALRSGRDRLGARCIYERIRWHTTIETSDDEFKINNNHAPYYARLLMLLDQRFDGFFERRDAQFDATDEQLLAAHNGERVQKKLFV